MSLTERILVRLSPDERRALKGAARFRDVSVSSLVRTAIRQEVELARQEWRERDDPASTRIEDAP